MGSNDLFLILSVVVKLIYPTNVCLETHIKIFGNRRVLSQFCKDLGAFGHKDVHAFLFYNSVIFTQRQCPLALKKCTPKC